MVSCKSNLRRSQVSGGLDLHDRNSCFRLIVRISHATELFGANRSILLPVVKINDGPLYWHLWTSYSSRVFHERIFQQHVFFSIRVFSSSKVFDRFFCRHGLTLSKLILMSMRTWRFRFCQNTDRETHHLKALCTDLVASGWFFWYSYLSTVIRTIFFWGGRWGSFYPLNTLDRALLVSFLDSLRANFGFWETDHLLLP